MACDRSGRATAEAMPQKMAKSQVFGLRKQKAGGAAFVEKSSESRQTDGTGRKILSVDLRRVCCGMGVNVLGWKGLSWWRI